MWSFRSQRSILLVVVFAVLAVACGGTDEAAEPNPTQRPLWLRDSAEPYPFTSPPPPLEATAIDGTYERGIARDQGGSVPCRRCAPYRLEVGHTTLRLEEGRYFITHKAPGKPDSSQFRSRGHFVIDGDEIALFNDANCPDTTGIYEWKIHTGELELAVVDDECPFSQLRQRFLMATSWVLQG